MGLGVGFALQQEHEDEPQQNLQERSVQTMYVVCMFVCMSVCLYVL